MARDDEETQKAGRGGKNTGRRIAVRYRHPSAGMDLGVDLEVDLEVDLLGIDLLDIDLLDIDLLGSGLLGSDGLTRSVDGLTRSVDSLTGGVSSLTGSVDGGIAGGRSGISCGIDSLTGSLGRDGSGLLGRFNRCFLLGAGCERQGQCESGKDHFHVHGI